MNTTGAALQFQLKMGLTPKKPFMPINCASLSPELAESELFGHERGSFTGAVNAEGGIIDEADGGTILLDEVDSLPLRVQTKLLRFLQEKEYRRLGSTKIRKADVRVITSTNSLLHDLVERKEFRQDLFYRLNVVNLTLPPLRDRVEDIQLLAGHFLGRCASEFERPYMVFSEEAMGKLLNYDWPGNVRELQNVIERAVILSKRPILDAENIHLAHDSNGSEGESFREAKAKTIEEFEKYYIKRLLLAYNGNISRAAKAAGKDRRAFWALIQKHDIDAGQFRAS